MIHHRTDRAPSHQSMAQSQLNSHSRVCTGSTAMASKIFLSLVTDLFVTWLISLKWCLISFMIGWNDDPTDRMLIAYSPQPSIITYLPPSRNSTSSMHLVVSIRDRLDSVVEVSLSSVIVDRGISIINNLLDGLANSASNDLKNDPVIQLLSSGNQNTVSQILSGVSSAVNGMNDENINQAVASECLCTYHLSLQLPWYVTHRWCTDDNYHSRISHCNWIFSTIIFIVISQCKCIRCISTRTQHSSSSSWLSHHIHRYHQHHQHQQHQTTSISSSSSHSIDQSTDKSSACLYHFDLLLYSLSFIFSSVGDCIRQVSATITSSRSNQDACDIRRSAVHSQNSASDRIESS